MTIELNVMFYCEVDDDLVVDPDNLCLDVPLVQVRLIDLHPGGLEVPAKFTEYETMSAEKIET